MLTESVSQRFVSKKSNASLSFSRWEGSVTLDEGNHSITIVGNADALESAIRGHLRGLRYVGQDAASQEAAHIRSLIADLTESYSYLENRFPEEVNKGVATA